MYLTGNRKIGNFGACFARGETKKQYVDSLLSQNLAVIGKGPMEKGVN